MSLSQNKQALFGGKVEGSVAGKSTIQSTDGKTTSSSVQTTASKTSGMSLKLPSSNPISNEEKRKKMEEARELSEKGMNALKTSLFQWSPDNLSASTYFERSANIYKQTGELKNAILNMLKAAECSEAAGTLASAAIARTKAGDWAKEKGNATKAIEYYEMAAYTWGLHGDLQKYGETLIKVAKEYEESDVNKAKETYLKGLEVLCPKSTPKEQLNQCHPILVDVLRNLLSFLVKNKFYLDAVAIADRIVVVSQAFELESNLCKALATITVLQLTMGDVVKAHQTFLQEHLSNAQYIKSKECELIDILVMACNQQDIDLLDKAKVHPQIHFLDFEIQKLIKNISLLGFEDNDEPSHPPSTVSKASLFQTKSVPKTSTFSVSEPTVSPTLPMTETTTFPNEKTAPLETKDSATKTFDDFENLDIKDAQNPSVYEEDEIDLS